MAFIRNTDKLIEGSINKFFTNARAKSAVQSDLDSLNSSISSEQSRAQAAESSLSSSISSEASSRAAAISQEVSDRQAAVSSEASARAAADSSEASARSAADSALSGRLNVIEGSGAGSVAKALSDAEAYADQKIADLINGAPAALDTLKEIADQLANDESAANALTAALAQEVSDRQAAVSAEASARATAVTAEQNRAEAAEAGLSSDLSAEVSRAEAAEAGLSSDISAEASARSAAVSAEASARAAADSSEASARSAADSALSGRLDSLELDSVTKSYVDSQVSAEESARISAVSAEQSRAQAAEAGLSSDLSAEVSRAEAAEASLSSAISQEVSDRQAAVSAEASARAAAVSAEASARAAADSALSSDISSEVSRAEAAEAGLSSDISAEASARAAAVSAEVSRAEAAEASLSSAISQEVSDRQAAVSAEASSRASAISAEASARSSADSALSGRLDVIEGSGAGSVAKALSDAEAYADQKISDLINGAPAMLDTLKEIADQLANDESAVSALTGTVAANLQTAKDYADAAVSAEASARATAVSAEQSRAQAAEALLANKQLSNLSSVAINADLLFGTDGSKNIGAAGASRAAKIFASGLMQVGGANDSTSIDSSAILSAVGSGKKVLFINYSDSTSVNFSMRRARGSEASPSATLSGDALATINMNGYNGSAFVSQVRIESNATEDTNGSNRGAKLNFYTTPNGSASLLPAMTIDQDQSVTALSALNAIGSINASSNILFVYDGLNTIGAVGANRADKAFVKTSMQVGSAVDQTIVNGPGVYSIGDQVSGRLFSASYGNSNYSKLSLKKARGSEASPSAVQSADILGTFTYSGYDGSTMRDSARLQVVAAENFSGSAGSQMQFLTVPNGSTTLTQAMAIDQDQSVLLSSPLLQIGGANKVTAVDSSVAFAIVSDGVKQKIFNHVYSPSSYPQMRLGRAQGSEASPSANNSGDILGRYNFGGHDGTVMRSSAYFTGITTEAWSGSARGTQVAVYVTANGSTSQVQALLIDQDKAVVAQGNLRVSSYAGSKALKSDANGNLVESSVTSTELGYLSGVTSGVQSQISTEVSRAQAEEATMVKLDGSRNMTGMLYMNAGASISGAYYSVPATASSNKTLNSTSKMIQGVTSLSSPVTFTLPAPAAGRMFVIKDQTGNCSVTNYIKVATANGELIEGASDYSINAAYESITIYCDGTNWYVI